MVETLSDARTNLADHVARFRADGVRAEPVLIGDLRQPDAVVLPYETYSLLLELGEDIALLERLRERYADDDGARMSLREVADELGVDLDRL